jgi:hypothetical protein
LVSDRDDGRAGGGGDVVDAGVGAERMPWSTASPPKTEIASCCVTRDRCED